MIEAKNLILVDLQSHSLGGHFKTWMNRTLAEALEYFDSVALYVADDFSRPDTELLGARQKNVSTFLIPEVYSAKNHVGDILSVICKHAGKVHSDFKAAPVFVMWAQQFLERDLIYPPLSSWNPFRRVSAFQKPWGSMTSISSIVFDPATAHPTEKAVHEMLQSDSCCRGVFLWDEFSAEKYPEKYIYLPNVEETIADPTWRMPMDTPPQIGSVGQLWGYRSVNLLEQVLSSENGLKGYLGGVLMWHSSCVDYSAQAIDMLKRPDSSSLTLEEGFLEKDTELNERLRKCDAFLIDGRTYKCPSGLGIRAMAMGRPLVSPDSPSWVSSLISRYGVGVFWKPEKKSLAADLRAWFDSGGPKRAVEVAQKLNDYAGLKKSYVEMFDRLCAA
jgi:hypothetical protein